MPQVDRGIPVTPAHGEVVKALPFKTIPLERRGCFKRQRQGEAGMKEAGGAVSPAIIG